jgi:hypothetical protein
LAAQGKSVIEQLAEFLGLANIAVVPDLGVQDGIQAVRMTLPKCWFDELKCSEGIEALRQYEREFDEDKKAFRAAPKHNWCSHPADAFRMLAVAWRGETPTKILASERPLIVGKGNTATLNDMWASAKPKRRARL